jgi:elongin-A
MAAHKFPILSVPGTGPPSLVDICLRKALKYVHLITSLGTMPSHYTQAILKAVKSTEQLREIELNSNDDDIYDQTAEHWQRFIKLKFPRLSAQHNFGPSNPKSWHKVYEHYRQLDAEEIAASTQLLQQRTSNPHFSFLFFFIFFSSRFFSFLFLSFLFFSLLSFPFLSCLFFSLFFFLCPLLAV